MRDLRSSNLRHPLAPALPLGQGGKKETLIQVVQIMRDDGAVAITKQIGKVVVAAGDHCLEFPFEEMFVLVPGVYRIRVASTTPGAEVDVNGVNKPFVDCWNTVTMTIK